MPDRTARNLAAEAARRLRAAARALRDTGPGPVEPPVPGGEQAGWWDLLPYTAHRIELAPGLWTLEEGVNALEDVRLDIVLDAAGGSIDGKRVVDLGCLEGGFTLAFAERGAAESLGIEARAISVRRCELARDARGVGAVEFVCGDIKDELRDRGPFDVVFAAGIVYHVGDPASLLTSMREACTSFALIDTHVAGESIASHNCSEILTAEFGGRSYRGRMFGEISADLDDSGREQAVWSAWSDEAAFWPLEDDLVAMIHDAGFASAEKIDLAGTERAPRWGVDQTNRVVYLARV